MDFWFVYIREAHASDSSWPARHVKIAQPRTAEARRKIAAGCAKELELDIPVLVDDMQDTVAKAYAAWPDRLYVLAADGTVAYAGARGPRGFRVDEMVRALEKTLDEAR